jgi:hypothetical protein
MNLSSRSTRTGFWLITSPLSAACSVMLAAVLVVANQAPAAADVTSLDGSAVGYRSNVGLFGSPPTMRGPSGTIGCAPPVDTTSCSPMATTGANGPGQDVANPGATATYGPATVFQSRGMIARAHGITGATGAVASSTEVNTLEQPFTADKVVSSCSAAETGVEGSASFTNARIYLQDPDTSTEGEPGEVVVTPTLPSPNTEYEGVVPDVGDRFRIVLNEQTFNNDVITVNAVHLYMLGPTAIGDVFVAQSHCGLAATSTNQAPIANPDAFTVRRGTPLTIRPPGVLANDTDPESSALRAGKLSPTQPPATGGGNWGFPSDPAHGTLRLGSDGSFTYTPNAGYVGPDSFTYRAIDRRGASASTTVTLTVKAVLAPSADFDGDLSTDVSVFRPSGAAWFVNNGESRAYGAAGDVAVPADYDGDGRADVAIFRPSTGLWAIHLSSSGVDAFVTYGGIDGDVPVPADYDGDGRSDIAVFRPQFGTWFVHRSSDNADQLTTFGISGDVPVVSDYDGDGKDDIAVFRPSGAWFVHQSSGSDTAMGYGTSGDVPVAGDYDGDAKADVAIFRPSTGLWALHKTTGGDALVTYGIGSDVPVPGDYDGDNRTDIALFRPQFATWFMHGSASNTDVILTFGLTTDRPLPVPASVRLAYYP